MEISFAVWKYLEMKELLQERWNNVPHFLYRIVLSYMENNMFHISKWKVQPFTRLGHQDSIELCKSFALNSLKQWIFNNDTGYWKLDSVFTEYLLSLVFRFLFINYWIFHAHGGNDSCFDFSMMFCSRIPEYDHCTKKKKPRSNPGWEAVTWKVFIYSISNIRIFINLNFKLTFKLIRLNFVCYALGESNRKSLGYSLDCKHLLPKRRQHQTTSVLLQNITYDPKLSPEITQFHRDFTFCLWKLTAHYWTVCSMQDISSFLSVEHISGQVNLTPFLLGFSENVSELWRWILLLWFFSLVLVIYSAACPYFKYFWLWLSETFSTY